MNIKPSAAIRQNYNQIADLCRKTSEPVFLTKNGEGGLVVMDIETYTCTPFYLNFNFHLIFNQVRNTRDFSQGSFNFLFITKNKLSSDQVYKLKPSC